MVVLGIGFPGGVADGAVLRRFVLFVEGRDVKMGEEGLRFRGLTGEVEMLVGDGYWVNEPTSRNAAIGGMCWEGPFLSLIVERSGVAMT
jgi:hypothetical protein